MAKSTTSFGPKDRIQHNVFGTGTIVEIDSRYTTIAFDEQGTRKFLTDKVKLASSDTQAPPTRSRRKTKTKAKTKTTKAKSTKTTKTKASKAKKKATKVKKSKAAAGAEDE